MSTDYKHDIFVSYKRQTYWTSWARDRFCAHLSAYLQQDLGYEPRIFMDEQMLPGRDLPKDLGENLAYSKIVLPLLSRDYFHSQWCIHELDLIYERNASHIKKTGGTQNIIVPVVVHDGEMIPDCIRSILYGDFSEYRRTTISPESQLAEDFSSALMKLSPAVQSAIQSAPKFDPNWIAHHKKRFSTLQSASSPPPTKNFTISSLGLPTAPPRPKMTTLTP